MALFYGIHDKWTDIDKENDVLVQSTEGVIDSIKVNGEEYGGGGSSDFSTAVMTITTSAQLGSYYALPHITDGGISTEPIAIFAAAPVEVIVPLYNGKLIVHDDYNNTFTSTTGDIVIDTTNGLYVITGNCTAYYEPV